MSQLDVISVCISSRDVTETFTISDSEILSGAVRFPSLATFIENCIQVGSRVLAAGSIGPDLMTVRDSLERAVADTRTNIQAMDEHLASLVSDEGPLLTGIEGARSAFLEQITQLVSTQGDIDSPGTLASKVTALLNEFESDMAKVREGIRADFEKTVEAHDQRIVAAARDIRELDPASALGAAIERIETRLTELMKVDAARSATAEERLRSAAKGVDFEDIVVDSVAAVCAAHGDRAEHTGGSGGETVLNVRASRRGDVTCYVAGIPHIVIEAMNRTQLSAKTVLAELDEACLNRCCTVGVAIMPSADNTIMCGQPFLALEPNRLAVVLDEHAPNLLALQVAYVVARQVALRRAETPTLDLAAMEDDVKQITQSLSNLSQVRANLATIKTGHDKAFEVVAKLERDVKTILTRMSSRLGAAEAEAA